MKIFTVPVNTIIKISGFSDLTIILNGIPDSSINNILKKSTPLRV